MLESRIVVFEMFLAIKIRCFSNVYGNLNSVFLECSLVSASCAMFLATLPQAGNEGKRSTLRSAFKRRGKKRKERKKN